MAMNIENAFCTEMKQIVDIYQARDFYEEQQNGSRLNFLCSSEDCRKAKVKVIGINYDKSFEINKTFVKPHFRENAHYIHSSNCIWQIFTEQIRVINNEDSSSEIIAGKRGKKLSPYVDIFLPKFNDRSSSEGRISAEDTQRLNLTENSTERCRILRDILRKSPSQSALLENVVNCYLSQTQEERKETLLTIERNDQSTYKTVFKSIKFFNLGETQNHIYYGGASIRKVYDSGYRLTFYDKEKSTNKIITLYLTKKELNKYKRSKFLLKILETALDSKKFYADCYFFGNINSSETNSNYLNVDLSHLDNLVLKLKEKQQK